MVKRKIKMATTIRTHIDGELGGEVENIIPDTLSKRRNLVDTFRLKILSGNFYNKKSVVVTGTDLPIGDIALGDRIRLSEYEFQEDPNTQWPLYENQLVRLSGIKIIENLTTGQLYNIPELNRRNDPHQY